MNKQLRNHIKNKVAESDGEPARLTGGGDSGTAYVSPRICRDMYAVPPSLHEVEAAVLVYLERLDSNSSQSMKSIGLNPCFWASFVKEFRGQIALPPCEMLFVS